VNNGTFQTKGDGHKEHFLTGNLEPLNRKR
jgi:hypothetical protein